MDILPPGKLIVTQNQTRYKWYVNDGKQLIYIPKARRAYAELLAKKKYLLLKLQALQSEKHSIQFFLSDHPNTTDLLYDFLLDHRYTNLLSSNFPIADCDLLNWSNSNYEKNNNYPEQLIHHTLSGNIVRSKSESIIDTALYTHQLPFRYEALLNLGQVSLFPDFTIMHPRNKEIIYWEHFGLMDHEKYSKNAFSKLELYTKNNIIPSINLITTYETKEHPLSASLVEQIIEHYFL